MELFEKSSTQNSFLGFIFLIVMVFVHLKGYSFLKPNSSPCLPKIFFTPLSIRRHSVYECLLSVAQLSLVSCLCSPEAPDVPEVNTWGGLGAGFGRVNLTMHLSIP